MTKQNNFTASGEWNGGETEHWYGEWIAHWEPDDGANKITSSTVEQIDTDAEKKETP